MTSNRKYTDTYRFNGASGLKSVGIAELVTLIKQYEAKLRTPNDIDDKKWTARWLKRFQRELKKKENNLAQKQVERSKRPTLIFLWDECDS